MSTRLNALKSLVAQLNPQSNPLIITKPWSSNYNALNAIPQAQDTTYLILDSSFNPPTIAHRRLLQHSYKILSQQGHNAIKCLVMFSVANVDKPLFGAGISERLMMMESMCRDFDTAISNSTNELHTDNVAIGVISAPRFIDKQLRLTEYFLSTYSRSQPSTSHPIPTLYFVVGMDTLTRIFDMKYYTSSSSILDNAKDMFHQVMGPFFKQCHLIVADRLTESSEKVQEEVTLKQFLHHHDVARLYSDRILSLDTWRDANVMGISSTECRRRVETHYVKRSLARPTSDGSEYKDDKTELLEIMDESVLNTVLELELYRSDNSSNTASLPVK